ncbi:TB2/DP1, HVA22 family-domain-containing protein [Obelidium mucronatum]|nr:TB2/DP1, HVA22 family-domain-containing protein [Obelidium mucronatum]
MMGRDRIPLMIPVSRISEVSDASAAPKKKSLLAFFVAKDNWQQRRSVRAASAAALPAVSEQQRAKAKATRPSQTHVRRQLQRLSRNSDLAPYLGYLHALARVLHLVEKYAHSFPLLMHLYRKYEVPPLTQAALIAPAALSVFRRAMQHHARLVSSLFGVAYPALMSVLAVERPRDGDEERLFTYWTAFGIFTVLDHLSPQILALYPAYFTTKMSILYWLYSKEGSFLVYRKFLRPLLVKHFSALGYKDEAE